jgi:hypothetical protein
MNSGRISKKTQHLSITKIKWLMLFEGIIPIYNDDHTEHLNTILRVTSYSSWYI